MTYRKRKGIRTAILALATAAILAPAAQAHTDFGSNSQSAGGYSPQALKAMDERWTKLADSYKATSSPSSGGYSAQALKALDQRWTKLAESYQATSPDDRGGAKGVGQTPTTTPVLDDYVSRQVANLEAESTPVVHVDDRAGVRGPGPVETPALVTTHDGFDWTDAGIGASAMLFVAALIAVAMLARRRPSIAV